MTETEQQRVVCTGCARMIPERVDFCPHCSAPIGPNVWLDPYKRIFAGGYVNRNFTSGHPRKWTMKFEVFISSVSILLLIGMAIHELFMPGKKSMETFQTLLYLMTWGVLVMVFNYRVIKNYKRLYGAPGDCIVQPPSERESPDPDIP